MQNNTIRNEIVYSVVQRYAVIWKATYLSEENITATFGIEKWTKQEKGMKQVASVISESRSTFYGLHDVGTLKK
jgi:hypothetical protein